MINGSFNTISTTNTAGLGVSSDPYSWIWSVQAVNNHLDVTFADLLNPSGGGGGAVDVFDTDGNYQYQLAANGPGTGPLQNPWGITQAPANFGAYSNDLLVGNVAGAGNINVYDPNTDQYLGQLSQPNGTPIAIKGLWDLEFGDGTPASGKTNQLFFDAGPNHPGDSTGGLFGVIKAAGDQSGNGGGNAAPNAALVGKALMDIGSTSAIGNNHSVGLASSPLKIGSQTTATVFGKSGAMSMTRSSDLRTLVQQIDAFFAKAPKSSTSLSKFDADLYGLASMVVRN